MKSRLRPFTLKGDIALRALRRASPAVVARNLPGEVTKYILEGFVSGFARHSRILCPMKGVPVRKNAELRSSAAPRHAPQRYTRSAELRPEFTRKGNEALHALRRASPGIHLGR